MSLLPLGKRMILLGDEYTIVGRMRKKLTHNAINWVEYFVEKEDGSMHTLVRMSEAVLLVSPCQHAFLSNKPLDVATKEFLDNAGFKLAMSYRFSITYLDGFFDENFNLFSINTQCTEYEKEDAVLISEEFENRVSWYEGLYFDELHYDNFEKRIESSLLTHVLEAKKEKRRHNRFLIYLFTSVVFALLAFAIHAYKQWYSPEKNVLVTTFQPSYYVKSDSVEHSPEYRSENFTLDSYSRLQIEFSTGIQAHWKEFEGALVNNKTGKTISFHTVAEYYTYSDDEGISSEGHQNPVVTLSSIEPGTYHINIQYFTDLNTDEKVDMTVTANAPSYASLYLLLTALFIVPIILFITSAQNTSD
jgi:hypothetical protein